MNHSTAASPASPLSLQGRSPFAIALAILAVFAATFLLPYLFPVAPVIAESYLVGFNNQVSLLSFVISMTAFVWWTKGFGISSIPVGKNSSDIAPSRTLFYWTLIGFFILLVAQWLFVRPHPSIREAGYFLDRLQHLHRGELPYRQFEFAYGPLLLYLPFAFSHVFHLSIEDSYFVSWIFEFIFGLYLVYLCVRFLPASATNKNIIFIMLAGPWFFGSFNLGCNYTPLRFFLAPFLCIVATRRLSSTAAPARIAVELIIGEALLLLISPEQAVAFCTAITVYLLLAYIQSRSSRGITRFGLSALVSAIVPALASYLGLFRTMSIMSHGGNDFPFLPVAQHIPIACLLCVSAATLMNTLRTKHPLGAIELLVLCGLFTLPAAFGRSDIGHVLLNCTAIILAAWFVLAQYQKPFLAVAPVFTLLFLFSPVFLTLPNDLRDLKHESKTSFVLLPSVYVDTATPSSVQKFRLLAPFDQHLPNSSQPFTPADTGYYFGFADAVFPSQIEQKVNELRAAPDRDILIPQNFSCAFILDRAALRETLGALYVPRAKRSSDIREPLCQYIHQRYRLSSDHGKFNGYEIWTPSSQ